MDINEFSLPTDTRGNLPQSNTANTNAYTRRERPMHFIEPDCREDKRSGNSIFDKTWSFGVVVSLIIIIFILIFIIIWLLFSKKNSDGGGGGSGGSGGSTAKHSPDGNANYTPHGRTYNMSMPRPMPMPMHTHIFNTEMRENFAIPLPDVPRVPEENNFVNSDIIPETNDAVAIVDITNEEDLDDDLDD